MYETILLVDDMEMERDLLKELLQDDYSIIEASSGQECIDIVEECREHIDLILLDLMMPQIDGFKVLEKRMEQDYFQNIPVIVLTGSGAVEDQVKAFELLANDFITKPILVSLAKSRINNVLNSNKRLMSLIKNSEEYKLKSELDQMTGLYNKITTEKRIDDILMSAGEKQHAMLVIDIDNFKSVNDTEGHQTGDHTIKIVADLLSSQFRNSDIIGRIGGDEFVVLMEDIPSEMIARQKAADIVRIMKYKPNLTIPANVSVSIGIAFSHRKLVDYRALFSMADEALYMSKQKGKACYTEQGTSLVVGDTDVTAKVWTLSNQRDVLSIIEGVCMPDIKIRVYTQTREICNKIQGGSKLPKILFVDVSSCEDDGKQIWNDLKDVGQFDNVSVIAICEEGNMVQYKMALSCDKVDDIISNPLEGKSLKRRIDKTLWETTN